MQNKGLWITVAALSVAMIFWGIWLVFKPQDHNLQQQSAAGSLQGILIEHIEHFPDVYRAHERYEQSLNDSSSALLIYRYSPGGCTPCFIDDLSELRAFLENVGRDIALVLPAYQTNDRNSRIRIANETEGLRTRNITPDSLALPACVRHGDMRYFAVLDEQGRVGMVFFPTRDRQDLTRLYFGSIARYFQ